MAGPAYADAQLHETLKLIASDSAIFDNFGVSVAISGDTAIVGAYFDDDKGADSGSAYLFDVTTGSQITKLTASDGAAGDHFGASVAFSGDTAVVGARGDDDAGSFSGSAYLFDGLTGNEIAKLTAADAGAGDFFGISVGISGDTVIIGAYEDDDAGVDSGSAYLFDVATGNQIAKLTASDAAAGDGFGFSVAICGDIAIVGAPYDDDPDRFSGSAYLFDVTTGNQIAKLINPDAAERDNFGFSVAISGDVAIVGAIGDSDAGTSSGSAYLFDVTTGNQIAKLTASDAKPHVIFGNSIAISGDTAIIGARWNYDAGIDSGSAYLFDIPEPASVAVLSILGLGTLALKGRRHKKTA